MKAWLKRIWRRLKADLSATEQWDDDEEEREHREFQERQRLERERLSRRSETDGFRMAR